MRPEDHPAERTAHLVGRRWTALVVRHLETGPLRHRDLLARMCGVSQKALTERLRDLQAHGAVQRQRVHGPDHGTVYSLTQRGHQLADLLTALERWGTSSLPPPTIASPFYGTTSA